MDGRRSGMILVAVGLVVVAIGVVGLVSDRGAATATVVGSVVASPSATPAPTPSAAPALTAAATPPPTPSPSATPDADTRIRAFYVVFVPAFKTGDAKTLLALVHPATIERYGVAACRASFAKLTDPTYAVVIKTIHAPAPWAYAKDGLTKTIADVWAVDVDVTYQGTTTTAVFHVAPVGGEIRWFADCGTPLRPSPTP